MLIAIFIALAGIAAAYSYQRLPRWFHAFSLRCAQYFPSYKQTLLEKLKGELDFYQAVLKDIPTYHTRAMYFLYHFVLTGVMTLLMVALLVLSQVVQMLRNSIFLTESFDASR